MTRETSSTGKKQHAAQAGPKPLLSVAYLGLDIFPFGLAEAQKAMLIAHGLLHADCDMTVINRWWSHQQRQEWNKDIPVYAEGVYEGIKYVYASGWPYRPQGYFRRKFLLLKGLANEAFILLKMRRAGELDAAILSTGSSLNVIYYWILSRLFSFRLILLLVESYSAMRKDAGRMKRAGAYVFDRHISKFVDGVLPISEYLIQNIRRFAPRTPWLKVPVLVDPARFASARRRQEGRYLLYCGYLGYLEVVKFLLQAFDMVRGHEDVGLTLVVNGSAAGFAALQEAIGQMTKPGRVRILSKVNDQDLVELYANAYALLIPLRPTVQDAARFPHKIGEYCASGRPIVTTALGEMPAYFTHGKDAFIAPAYDPAAYAQVLEEALANPDAADAVGACGKVLAEREFSYKRFGPEIRDFISSLR